MLVYFKDDGMIEKQWAIIQENDYQTKPHEFVLLV